MIRQTICVLVAASFGLLGCSKGTEGAADGPDVTMPDAGGTDGAGGGMDGGDRPDTAKAGGNTISGSVGGKDFNTVAAAYWIGAPDDDATTVVYLFDQAVKCADLAKMGWDARIPDKTQVLEMKMFGTTLMTYKVTISPTPAPGEASVNYTLSARTGTPKETFSSAGTVTLASLQQGTEATGSFALMFGAEHLMGTYQATYCAGGHEP